MTCPQPLDPLCVAIMLRLADAPVSGDKLARDLQVSPLLIEERIQRLRSLGALEQNHGTSVLQVRPDAFRIILQITESQIGRERTLTPARRPDTLNSRLTLLQQDPMFQALPYEELSWLARVSRTQELGEGELLLLEGDECRGLYIVDSGTVRLSKGSTSCAGSAGREQTIRLMGHGESFNEVPVFDGGPNPVTAEAVEASRVIMVPKQEVRDLVQRSPEFAQVIITIMSQRLRHMLAMIEDVSMRDVTGRVAKILLQVTHPTEGVGAGLTVGRKLTQREIAEMAGTAREVVARALKKLERAGAITVRRGDVQIVDVDLLESLT